MIETGLSVPSAAPAPAPSATALDSTIAAIEERRYGCNYPHSLQPRQSGDLGFRCFGWRWLTTFGSYLPCESIDHLGVRPSINAKLDTHTMQVVGTEQCESVRGGRPSGCGQKAV